MTLRKASLLLAAGVLALTVQSASAQQVTLTLESWRGDDAAIWNDTIIPAFEASHPNIKVVFQPTAPTEYSAAMGARLEGGTAGDIITCSPFDAALDFYNRGYLAPLNDLPGMENFSPVAKSAWSTDDQSTTYCVPLAAVIHGFIYNKDIFAELGIEPPKTEAEFFAALDKIKADGRYAPLDIGAAETWVPSALGFLNIGPTYWKGEEGRLGLIEGTQKLTDEQFVGPLRTLAAWKPYLPSGFEAQTYADSQNLFTLGRAAIYPAGSWEISGFNANADFELGAFPPPVRNAGDQCYITDHTDMGMGMNANTAHPAEAREFLSWIASAEFAGLYANALPGFFSLNSTPVTLEDPLAAEFASWRANCESTIRASYAILSRGTPNLDNDMSEVSIQVLKGEMTPEAGAQRLQEGLDSWYKPAGN
jgi:raffinose/stachyose/melibiose transport system substrate-binding protein